MEFSGCIWLGVEDFFEAKRSGMKDLHLCMNMVVLSFFLMCSSVALSLLKCSQECQVHCTFPSQVALPQCLIVPS